MDDGSDGPGVSRRTVLSALMAGGGVIGSDQVDAATADSDRYVVGLSSETSVDDHVATLESTNVHRRLDFGTLGSAIAGQFPGSMAERFRTRPEVRYVERDERFHVFGVTVTASLGGCLDWEEEKLPWGVDRIDADVVHSKGLDGEDVTIAIGDTGIYHDHEDLRQNLGTSKQIVECDPDSSLTDCNSDWAAQDDVGHGTFMAGIVGAVDDDKGILGVAPGATLDAVKYVRSDSTGYVSDMAEGIRWAADQGADVMNMSHSSPDAKTLHDAVRYASDNDVVLVASVGNEGEEGPVGYPAAYPEVVAVSAIREDDSFHPDSSRGPEVELAAPGGELYSTIPSDCVPYVEVDALTSGACAHVSGVAALLLERGYSADEVRQRLRDTAENVGGTTDDDTDAESLYGHGLVDAATAAFSLGVETKPPTDVTGHSATVVGEVTEIEPSMTVQVHAEYRAAADDGNLRKTDEKDVSSPGEVTFGVEHLETATTYRYEVIVSVEDVRAEGGTVEFTTRSGDA